MFLSVGNRGSSLGLSILRGKVTLSIHLVSVIGGLLIGIVGLCRVVLTLISSLIEVGDGGGVSIVRSTSIEDDLLVEVNLVDDPYLVFLGGGANMTFFFCNRWWGYKLVGEVRLAFIDNELNFCFEIFNNLFFGLL